MFVDQCHCYPQYQRFLYYNIAIIDYIHFFLSLTIEIYGPDGIPTSLLINCAEEIAPVLKIMFSHSLSSSLIATSFKEAAIIPVFKSGDKSLPSSYRPISLTSVLTKVIEYS